MFVRPESLAYQTARGVSCIAIAHVEEKTWHKTLGREYVELRFEGHSINAYCIFSASRTADHHSPKCLWRFGFRLRNTCRIKRRMLYTFELCAGQGRDDQPREW